MWQNLEKIFKNLVKWTLQKGIGLVAFIATFVLGLYLYNNYQNTLIDSDVLACKELAKEKIPKNTYYLLFSHSRAERFKDVLFFHPLSKLVPPDSEWKKNDERLSYFDFRDAYYFSYVVHLIDVVRANVSRDEISMHSTKGSEYAEGYTMVLDREELYLYVYNRDNSKEIIEKNKEWKKTKNKL
jgi:hypothetical protein